MTTLNKKIVSMQTFLVLISLLLVSYPANADRIVPSSRVTNCLNVREHADVNSEIVGSLRPNESAELIESVPYWFHIRLDNGTPGYVSKAWAKLIPNAEESGELIRLGSWNIKKLGHGSSKDFPLVAQIIESNFDIVVVVEVMQKQGGHPGYENLLSALGSNWTGMVTDSPRPNTTAGHSEFYAILYRPALLSPCQGWNSLVYHIDNDGSGSGSGSDYFSREPAYICMEAPGNNTAVGIDFLIAAYHARWEGGNITKIKGEVEHLDEVFEAMRGSRPGERDIFIAGDFNLVPSQIETVMTPRVRTQGTGSTLNSSGQRTTNLYDHLFVYDDDATSEMIGDPEVIDVRDIASGNQIFYQTISDHLPIVVRLRTVGPDDD